MRRIVTVSLVALLLAGCGPKRTKTGTVSGKVSYKGQPVNGAALLLYPAAEGNTAITVSVNQAGEYHIVDVPAGEYKIVVRGTAGAQQVDPRLLKKMSPDKQAEVKEKLSHMNTPPTIKFPDKYKDPKTTDLKVTITDKDQSKDLDLEGPAGAGARKES
jgi:hypothetical protein